MKKKPCRSDTTSSGLTMFRKLSFTPPRKMGKYFVFFALWAGWACKLSTPAAFVDEIKGGVTLTNLKNVTTGYAGELYSGVITGTLTGGTTSVKFSFDNEIYKAAIITNTTWKIFIPTGIEASTGKNRWQTGSKHSLKLKVCSANENCNAAAIDINFVRQQNKDINGDGLADLVIGASSRNAGLGASQGSVYIFYGGLNGIAHGSAATAATVVDAEAAGNNFGYTVALADVNGDSYADLAVGAYNNNSGAGPQQGAVYIFLGSSAGISSQGAASANAKLSGEATIDLFGDCVSFGDINGDGFADLAVGAWYRNAGAGTQQGVVYIFQGNAQGISSKNAANASAIIKGETSGDYFGHAIAIGDANGDGFGDLAASSLLKNAGAGAQQGVVYLFHGSISGITAQTVTSANATFAGLAASDQLGGALAFGDVNRDGFNDLAMGARGRNALTGAVYIFQGGASGLASQSIALANTIIAGESAGDKFGNSISFGDVNADGFSDMAVGAFERNAGAGGLQGCAYIFQGSVAGLSSQGAAIANTILIGQTASNQFGNAVGYADLNGDGYADLTISANIRNAGAGVTQGVTYIFQGNSIGIPSQGAAAANSILAGQAASNAFGTSVSYLAPASLDTPTPRRSILTTATPEEYALLRRREENRG